MLGDGEERKLKEANKSWNFPVSLLWDELWVGLGSPEGKHVHSDSRIWRYWSLHSLTFLVLKWNGSTKPMQGWGESYHYW